uniref:Response regulatory domain-containing protein n=1 Tax=uncultured Elusimicrobia bacterium TaxID=699876 RepID=A0A650EMJ6_9BACT|nr:hypothetical protein Elusimicrob2101_0990 [uncultured Elusimicrobia bacterium]
MNYTAKILTSLICAGVLTPCGWAQVPQAVKAVRGVSSASALGRMDTQVAAGQKAVAAARAAAAAQTVRTPVRSAASSLSRNRLQFENIVTRPIVPTVSADLRPRLVAPTLLQTQEVVRHYETFFADLDKLRKETDPLLGNALREHIKLSETLHPTEVGYYSAKLHMLELRAVQMQKTLFPTDEALKEALEYIQTASMHINKFYTPEVSEVTRAVRPYVQDEFWMEYDWRKGVRDESLTQLPENVHMAVLNDTQDILYMYKQWEREGRFPKGWKVSVYEDTKHLLEALESGSKFDLIISDINVPGGGGRYFVSRLREIGSETPVIGCSMYTRDKIDSEELHDIGFDGYMYGDDMFEESAGFYKWSGYIKNYYYYKRVGNWKR